MIGDAKQARDEITLTGSWDAPEPDIPPPVERRRIIVTDNVRAFGVDWWTWRTTFDADCEFNLVKGDDGLSTYTMSARPVGDVVRGSAPRWRRIGYWTIGRLVLWWRERRGDAERSEA